MTIPPSPTAWRLPSPGDLAIVEGIYGFRFPPAFLALLDRPPPALRRMFPHGRFALPEEVRAFRKQHGFKRLVPFLLDPQPRHEDIYCFDLETPAPDVGIAVFAVHTTVADWPNLAAWLTWVETFV